MIIRALDLKSGAEAVVVSIETAFNIIEVMRAEHITDTQDTRWMIDRQFTRRNQHQLLE